MASAADHPILHRRANRWDWSWVDEQRFAAIWVKDGLPLDWDAEWDLTQSELDSRLQYYETIGLRPISIEGMVRGTEDQQLDFERRYAVVAARKEDITVFGDWTYSLGVSDVLDELDDMVWAGWVPYYISTVHLDPASPSAVEFNVLYAEAPSPGLIDVQTRVYQTASTMQADTLRSQGYHLVSVARAPSSISGFAPRFTGIWHRYGWAETVEGDIATEAEDLADLEDLVKLLMTGARIPAAQLAVMKGDELVLSRAYTRAPVAYAPITTATPMMAASITKPLTAVLALDAFTAGNLDNDLMALLPEPTMGSKPNGTITIRQALQHTSGFNIGNTNGPDGSALTVKTAMGGNRLPTSLDWLEYMGNLQANNPPLGWSSQQQGTFQYNNFGYEMVAFGIKVAASINPNDREGYESLMDARVFDRVDMCRSAFKHQGLIDTAVPWTAQAFSEPEYGGCNSGCTTTNTHHYLIEPTHPYWGASPITEINNPGNFFASALDESQDPLERIAPDFARNESYGAPTRSTPTSAPVHS